ncbi:short-chain dehydrogenase [Variovorax gossypii]|jgi:hypothetical protein|uniref:Short-chain dehydrogenase n=1 Tax=Variovorax gossypii TaxID=1679495 RepID=A0A431TNN6_9BURK|nr:short-chain dehydrogenase [Variovorax gossypii]MDP9605649.1 hypothetical protein [Variovorax paradoxus]RTQ35384.1 short-chain dehydrogenase [Variovorax gossypii]
MRKRNTPIRMIAVRPAQPRERGTVLGLARRFGLMAGTRSSSSCEQSRESPLEALDLDQRVRAVGEW